MHHGIVGTEPDPAPDPELSVVFLIGHDSKHLNFYNYISGVFFSKPQVGVFPHMVIPQN